MNKIIYKNMNIIFSKMYNIVKLDKYTEKEMMEILSKDREFINASIVVSVYSAIKYEINKSLENLKRVCLNDT